MSAPTSTKPFANLAFALEAMRTTGMDLSRLAPDNSHGTDEAALLGFATAHLDPEAAAAYTTQAGRPSSATMPIDHFAAEQTQHSAPNAIDIDGPRAPIERRIHVSYEVLAGQYSKIPTEITVTVGKMSYRLSLAEETCLVYNARENAAQARVITAVELEMINALLLSELKKADSDLLMTPLTALQKQGILKFLGTKLTDLYAESFKPRVTIERQPVFDDLEGDAPPEGALSKIHMRLHNAYITFQFDPNDPNAVEIQTVRMTSIANTPIGEVIRPVFDASGPTASEIRFLLDELPAISWRDNAEFEFIIALCEELTSKYALTDEDEADENEADEP